MKFTKLKSLSDTGLCRCFVC